METIKKIVAFLDGKKTYIVSGLFIAVQIAQIAGLIEENVAIQIQGLLLGTGLVTIRLGISKK